MPVIFGVLFLIWVAATIASERRWRRRIESYRNWIEKYGWKYREAAQLGLPAELAEFSLASEGHNHGTDLGYSDVLTGNWNGRGTAAFQVTLSTPRGRGAKMEIRHLVMTRMECPVPRFLIRPKKLYRRIVVPSEFANIAVDSQIDSQYDVFAQDAPAVTALLSPTAREMLMAGEPQLAIEARGSVVAVFGPAHMDSLDELSRLLDLLTELAEASEKKLGEMPRLA